MIRYWPVPSVTAVRVFSMSTGLETSTVTPGSTAPDASRTMPVSDPCAWTGAGSRRTARIARHFVAGRRESLPVAADVSEVAPEGAGQFEQQLRRARAEAGSGRDIDRHDEELVGVQIQAAEENLLAVRAPVQHGVHAVFRHLPFLFTEFARGRVDRPYVDLASFRP